MRRRSLSSTPLWIIALLGIGITALGVYIQSTGSSPARLMSAGTLLALGGGVVGAAISIHLSAADGRDLLSAVHQMLDSTLGVSMRSREADLAPSRRTWHCYWVTQKNGTFRWALAIYHFERGRTPGLATAELTGIPPHGGNYRVEMAIRGNRMLFAEAPEAGSEPPTVGIVPYFTEGFRDVHAGVVLVPTWDGTELLSKCLWSITPLVNSDEISHDDSLLLDSIWDRTFPLGHTIFPAIGKNPA